MKKSQAQNSILKVQCEAFWGYTFWTFCLGAWDFGLLPSFYFIPRLQTRLISLFAFFSPLLWRGAGGEASAQLFFARYDSMIATEAGDTLKNAWAGGINSALFSEIDLDLDGRKDIFLFEKDGFIVKTFLNNGTSYRYAPEYQEAFPKMTIFSLLADYNCDGKEDLFTSAPGGMAVYKNISSQLGGLKFTLETPILKADYNPGYYNLYVAATDIPALADIDGDGDMDILSFETGGSVVYYFRNFSLETYGTCDSLKFQVEDACWGKFYENPNNNSVVFPVSCKNALFNPEAEGEKHTGSTLLAINLDGDTDRDLLLGDVSFKNMVGLTNGGDSLAAAVTAQDISYPSNTTPVNLLFPAGFYFDADNDSIRDLLVAPNTSVATENFTSVWFYKNSGSDNNPVFTFQKNDFLQETMIDLGSGSNPAFFDYNADGLMDLVIGNYGYFNAVTGMYDGRLALFENTGTADSPSFRLTTRDYAGVSAEKKNALYPAFGDIDSDGDKDMFIGEYDGAIMFYENTAGPGDTANFVLKSAKYKNIDVGHFAAPQLADLNRDGLIDLLVGEQDGTLNYFQNAGTAATPDFSNTPTLDSLGGIDVEIPCCTGYNTPFLFQDSMGNYALLVGSQKGTIYYYIGIDGNLNGNFTLADSILTGEFRTSISMADIDNDGKNELAVGSYPGGMHILKTDFLANGFGIGSRVPEFQIFPNPTNGKIEIRSDSFRELGCLEIYNILGKKVYTNCLPCKTKQGWAIDLSNQPPGIYFLQISEGEKVLVRKAIKL